MPGLAATEAARIAHRSGIPTVVDVEKVRPHIEDLLAEIDVIIASQAFPTELTGYPQIGQALEHLEREFPAWVVCATLGSEGSLARVGGREFRTPAFRTPSVDTTGAGDVFRGGFVSGWLASGDEGSVDDILTFANAVAALKCRALGAREGIPRLEEVAELIHSQSRQR
jgi:sugar/nucleoside kinase (ribokinase family)